jgi:hypothetical protein
MQACIEVLERRPPATHREARGLFAYFANRLGEIGLAHINRLKDMKFIPIFAKSKEKPIFRCHESPVDCFLGESETYGEIFNYVDFGHEANSFLIRCGSKLEPSIVEISQILIREPARISSTFKNAEKYLSLLRRLADNVSVLRKNKELFREMKSSPFLLASKDLPPSTVRSGSGPPRTDDLDDLDDEEAQGIREYQLCSASHAIIVDDFITFNLFKANILAAPQEEILEDFYAALGTPTLSSLVEEAARHGPRAQDQRPAMKLQKQIFERSRLFLHDQSPEIIKHDSRWLEKNLSVQLVSSISLRRSLKGRDVTHTEKRTAVITQVNREFTLWITGERPDLYQVSQALVHLLLQRPRPHSALTLEMLLKTDLLELRARGFNVSRILRQKAAEARLAESKRQQELEAEQKRIQEQEQAWKASQEQLVKDKAHRPQLPGGFPDSPEPNPTQSLLDAPNGLMDDESRRNPRSLLTNLSRQLGFGNNRQVQSLLGGGRSIDQPQSAADPPPPYSDNPDSATNGTTTKQKTPGSSVTAPHQLRENLLSAIRKTRPHNSSSIFTRGESNQVSETKSYCDERPAHDLTFIADIKHGIQMFLSPSSGINSSDFLRDNSAGLTRFATLIKSVGDVFSLDPKTLNIFYETSGKTIGFNRNGSIFCNYMYFQHLHEKQLLNDAAGAYADAFVYWWVILCHELAHNLVADHSSDHSYYTEGFVASYFGRVVEKISAAAAAGQVGTSTPVAHGQLGVTNGQS